MGRHSIIEPTPQPLPDSVLVAKLLRALGDPTRLRIIEILMDGPRFQKQIIAEVGLSQGQVSSHLACLTWCGLVGAKRQGRHVEYVIGDPRVVGIVDLARATLEGTESAIAQCRRVD